MVTDWQRFVGEHGPIVFATAWRILAHVADTEDVSQEVFLEAYRLQQSQNVNHWPALLRRIATCRALDRLRRRRPEESVDDLAPIASGENPEAEAIGHELEERFREEIARLPPRQAEVFCLRYFEGLDNEQIAAALEIDSGAVSTALHKARTHLATALVQYSKRENL